MISNILIISSNHTGHGHKSICESLIERFSLHPDVNVHVVDGFSLAGKLGLRIGKMYGSVTRNAKELWKLMWEISSRKPSLVNDFTESSIRENFLRLLATIKPDLILSVHPNFNEPILNILEDYKINIFFLTLVADLVSISPLWVDPRADYIICPSKESKYKCLEFGVSESKLKVTSFPVRKKFLQPISSRTEITRYNGSNPLECLIMSGGEGSGNMRKVAKILLSNFDCRVKIIAGRNEILKRRLERVFAEQYKDKVKIYGFVENIQDLMITSDIAFTRGSPNVMMEAVACNVPLIITGNLPGQEEGNPSYLQKYNLGLVCKEPAQLKHIVADLLYNNAEKLNNIRQCQRSFFNPNASKDVVDFILNLEKKGCIHFPDKIHNRWYRGKKISVGKKLLISRHNKMTK